MHRSIFTLFCCAIFMLSANSALARFGPGGRLAATLVAGQTIPAGTVAVYNTRGSLNVETAAQDGWLIKEIQIFAGDNATLIPMTKDGNPIPGKFPFKAEYTVPVASHVQAIDFFKLGFAWGSPYESKRLQRVAVHADLVKLDAAGAVVAEEGAWAYSDMHAIDFPGAEWGWFVEYEMAHPKRGHFWDSPVDGLSYETGAGKGKTAEGGAFDYFPGEKASFAVGNVPLGTAVADHRVTPLDLFNGVDTNDLENNPAINLARLLQSLDDNQKPKDGIRISDAAITCLNAAAEEFVAQGADFTNTAAVEALINTTVTCDSTLVAVSAEDAKVHLDAELSNVMFRRNVSKTPELASAKSKMNDMRLWFPAKKANGDTPTFTTTDENGNEVLLEGIAYYDELGNFVRSSTEARPLVVVYADEVAGYGAMDVFAAVSRDDGATWKRKNISRMADRSSFLLENGEAYYGDCKKPVFQIQGNKILVAWTSKFARGGRPAYAIKLCDDPATTEVEGTGDIPCATYCNGTDVCEVDYQYDDPYWVDDIWGVAGPQRSHDYTDEGYPEVGEVPYSAVWTARGVIATQAEIDSGVYASLTITDDLGDEDPTNDITKAVEAGDILWFKPERLTSARRDANQVFMGGSDGAGMAIAWQEDPEGLRPGEAKGPGPGWGGATTNHKTDIWYSYITLADFAKIDANFVPGGDPEHDLNIGRPKALVPMSLPVRVSDNDVVNTDNLMVELDSTTGLPVRDENGNFTPVLNEEATSEDAYGSHRYGYLMEGLWNWDGKICIEGGDCSWDETANEGTLYEFINQQGVTKRVVVTADGRALDGNTGASRPNLFLQTYTKTDGTKSAWAILAYEESKGVGLGPPDDAGSDPDEADEDSDGEHLEDGSGYDPYETFPDSGKNVIYHSFDFKNPDRVSAGTVLNLPETDGNGNPLYVVQPPYIGSVLNADGTYTPIVNPDAGEPITDWKGDPIYAYENARRPRFLLQGKDARGTSGTVLIVLYKEGEEGAGRPSDILARRCVVSISGNPYAPANFVAGAQNLSTVTPEVTWINPDRDEDAKGDGVKVCTWTQPEANLLLKSGVNPYEDARAHRGAIRGDFVIMGYSYTPNWAASRNAHDKYDFYIRRSFDGGQTWTTDPAAYDEDGNAKIVMHEDIFIDPEGVSGSELPAVDEEGNDITEATKHFSVFSEYGPGVYEPARNVSLLKNNKTSVIEPRLVGVPGTIKINGVNSANPEDIQNGDVFYVAYGTATNLRDVDKTPEDLFYSFSMDRGTTLVEDSWQVNPDSAGNFAGEWVTRWAWLAKQDPEQGEVQLRMTPDGSKFYACWLEEGEDGSDIMFRRILPWQFESNSLDEYRTDYDGDGFNEYQGDAEDDDSTVYPGVE